MSIITLSHPLQFPSTDESVPLMMLNGLEHSVPTELKGVQQVLHPHIDTMMLLWWIAITVTLGYVGMRFVVLPLVERYTGVVE